MSSNYMDFLYPENEGNDKLDSSQRFTEEHTGIDKSKICNHA